MYLLVDCAWNSWGPWNSGPSCYMDDDEDYDEVPENAYVMKSDIVPATEVGKSEDKEKMKDFCKNTDNPACISRYNDILLISSLIFDSPFLIGTY